MTITRTRVQWEARTLDWSGSGWMTITDYVDSEDDLKSLVNRLLESMTEGNVRDLKVDPTPVGRDVKDASVIPGNYTFEEFERLWVEHDEIGGRIMAKLKIEFEIEVPDDEFIDLEVQSLAASPHCPDAWLVDRILMMLETYLGFLTTDHEIKISMNNVTTLSEEHVWKMLHRIGLHKE